MAKPNNSHCEEQNTVSSFSNIFGNVGLQNKEVRINFIVVWKSFENPMFVAMSW